MPPLSFDDPPRLASKPALALALTIVGTSLLASCGARSPLDSPDFHWTRGAAGTLGAGGDGESGGRSGSAGGSGEGGLGGTGAGGQGGAPGPDPCVSAIRGPQAMWRACSTRDGRARVPAPTAPHVTWTTKLPTDATGRLGLSHLATDDAQHVFVVTTDNFDDMGQVRRVRTTDGVVEWSAAITPDSATAAPMVLKKGPVQLFAYDPKAVESLARFDAATGKISYTTLGVDLYDGAPNPAVTSDGGLLLVHSVDVGTATSRTYLSRIRPNDSIAWTSLDLGALIAAPKTDNQVFPSTVAVTPDGLAVVVVGIVGPSGSTSTALAFDKDGNQRWATPVKGQLLGGPVVRPDGTIAVVAGPLDALDLVLLDPTSGAATMSPLSDSLFDIFAVTRTGVLIAGTDAGNGIDGIAAIDGAGKTLWTSPGGASGATVSSDGTVVVFGPTIRALDSVTGAVRWQLLTPDPTCLSDAALASDGTLVGLGCDGTLFGAGD